MLFYRTSKEARFVPMHVRRVRILSVLSLVAYPVGAMMVAVWGERQVPLQLVGYGLIFISLVAFAGIVSTGVQRITAEQRRNLDSLELELRQQAYAMAFHILATIGALSTLYCMIAIDASDKIPLWVPTTSDHWNGIFWAIMVAVFVLPTACLSWRMPVEDTEADA